MKGVVSEYRKLLTAEESVPSLQNALGLTLRIASGEGNGARQRWRSLVPVGRAITPESRSQLVKTVSWALSELPQQIKRNVAKLPESQYSLLMDTLMLVFHQAYFALLPEVPGERHTLLNTFRSLSEAVPYRPDRFQILGLIAVDEGDLETAAESFRTAVAATHSDQHDFVTRVQLLWSILMEHRRWSDAFHFLLDIYPRVSRSDLDEVQQMLSRTFIESQKRRPANSAPRATGS